MISVDNLCKKCKNCGEGIYGHVTLDDSDTAVVCDECGHTVDRFQEIDAENNKNLLLG